MLTYKSYNELTITTPPAVLGYRLRPLSLGHVKLLRRLGNGFITGKFNHLLDINNIIAELLKVDSAGELYADLLLAVLVCSETYDNFVNDVTTGAIVKLVEELQADIKDNKFEMWNEIHAFGHYIHNGTKTYEYNILEQENSNGSSSALEWEETVKKVLMTETTYTRSDILDLPLTEVQNDFLIIAHDSKAIEITSKEKIDAINELKGNK